MVLPVTAKGIVLCNLEHISNHPDEERLRQGDLAQTMAHKMSSNDSTDDHRPLAPASDPAKPTSPGSPPGNGQMSSTDRAFWPRVVDRMLFRSAAKNRHSDHALQERIGEIIDSSDGQVGADPAFAHERALLTNILKLSDMTAYDVMVPRAEISAIQESINLDDIVSLACEASHSRFPVYQESLDNVIGMIHIKDVLACMRRNDFDLHTLLRPLLFVAPSMRVLDLLWKMRLSRRHMALVIDEYGGIDGLVTIEDLVETIVGQIEDEHDQADVIDFVIGLNGTVLADARTPIEDFEDRFGAILTQEEREDDIDTLGGLVFYLAGRVPARHELLTHDTGLTFEILEADPRRVKRLRIHGLIQDGEDLKIVAKPPAKEELPDEAQTKTPDETPEDKTPPPSFDLKEEPESDDDSPQHGRVAVRVKRG